MALCHHCFNVCAFLDNTGHQSLLAGKYTYDLSSAIEPLIECKLVSPLLGNNHLLLYQLYLVFERAT